MEKPTSTRERRERDIAKWTVESVGSASRTPGLFDKIGHKCAVRGPTRQKETREALGSGRPVLPESGQRNASYGLRDYTASRSKASLMSSYDFPRSLSVYLRVSI